MTPFATEFPVEANSNRADFDFQVISWLRGIRQSTLLAERGPDVPEQLEVGNWRGVSSVVDGVRILDHLLQEADFDKPAPELGEGEFFSLGTITAYGGTREIHRGFVQPVLRLPVAAHLPDRVVAFLVSISGDDDLLDRENHSNMGYHYHYLNSKKQRSAVVICWDIRATEQTPHPLFQEKHGEAHSKFSGRPDLWGKAKRGSIHEACAPDLKWWSLDKFRMASDKAGPVWPLGAALTPRSTSSAASLVTKAKRKRR
jgi:hypothetical protein